MLVHVLRKHVVERFKIHCCGWFDVRVRGTGIATCVFGRIADVPGGPVGVPGFIPVHIDMLVQSTFDFRLIV
jgi:hypothetical protein